MRKIGKFVVDMQDLGCNNKAKRLYITSGADAISLCLSYESVVAGRDANGQFHLYRCAKCQSATTKRHIVRFLECEGQSKGFINTLKWED